MSETVKICPDGREFLKELATVMGVIDVCADPSETIPIREVMDKMMAQAVAERDSAQRSATMLEVLRGVDQHWTEDYPGGPDMPSILHHTTITLWRSIRAAIARRPQ